MRLLSWVLVGFIALTVLVTALLSAQLHYGSAATSTVTVQQQQMGKRGTRMVFVLAMPACGSRAVHDAILAATSAAPALQQGDEFRIEPPDLIPAALQPLLELQVPLPPQQVLANVGSESGDGVTVVNGAAVVAFWPQLFHVRHVLASNVGVCPPALSPPHHCQFCVTPLCCSCFQPPSLCCQRAVAWRHGGRQCSSTLQRGWQQIGVACDRQRLCACVGCCLPRLGLKMIKEQRGSQRMNAMLIMSKPLFQRSD